jgi:homoserine kinase type II
LKGKKSTIVTFLNGSSLKAREDGYYDNIKPHHCYEIGKVLARLHLATADFNMLRENELNPLVLRNLFNKIQYLHRDLRAEILENLDFLEKNWQSNLPSDASHLDLFPDNVFFNQEGKMSGVIDFYFAANDLLIYDFAIAVNAWCFDERNNFDQQKFDEILRGYEEVRKFSAQEKEFLKIALVGAAMRFLLTRLHDMFAVSTETLIKIKNPKEYLAKLRFFKSK